LRIPVNEPLSCSSFCLAAARAIVTPPFADFDQLAKLLNDASDVREASQTGPAFQMIVCSCNVLSDHDIRNAVSGSGSLPRNAKQLYGCLGCSADCGRCARTINTIIEEALGPCAKACCAGCPHSQEAASSAKTRALARALRESQAR